MRINVQKREIWLYNMMTILIIILCSMMINNDSFTNVTSLILVRKLNLNIFNHAKLYKL